MERAIDLAGADYGKNLELQLARLLLQTEEEDKMKEATLILTNFTYKNPKNVEALTLLTIGYGKRNQWGKAYLAGGQKSFALGDTPAALEQLEMALEILPENSPSWFKAQDLLEDILK